MDGSARWEEQGGLDTSGGGVLGGSDLTDREVSCMSNLAAHCAFPAFVRESSPIMERPTPLILLVLLPNLLFSNW